MKKESNSVLPLLFGGAFSAESSNETLKTSGYYISGGGGAQLYVEESGKGAPVIFLSGGPGLNPDYIQPVWSHFVDNYRCIVLHQRGTGKSLIPVVDASSISMDNYVSDLEALRHHLQVEKLTLVGHSWGGMLAMLFLSKKPAHTEKLVLIDPGGFTMSTMQDLSANMAAKLDEEGVAELKKAGEGHMPNMTAIWLGYFYHKDRAMATRHLAKDSVGQEGINGLAFAGFYAGSDEMVASLKRTAHSPVILIKGKEDPIGEATIDEIKSVLPQTVIHKIDKCGHLPWMENPEQVAEFFSLLAEALK